MGHPTGPAGKQLAVGSGDGRRGGRNPGCVERRRGHRAKNHRELGPGRADQGADGVQGSDRTDRLWIESKFDGWTVVRPER